MNESNYLMGVYVYLEGYAHSDFGRGAAISVLMLLIVAALSVFYVRRMVRIGGDGVSSAPPRPLPVAAAADGSGAARGTSSGSRSSSCSCSRSSG